MPKPTIAISGPWLKGMRESRYYTQEELARAIGLSSRGIQRIELAGDTAVNVSTARRLAEFLNLSPEEFRLAAAAVQATQPK